LLLAADTLIRAQTQVTLGHTLFAHFEHRHEPQVVNESIAFFALETVLKVVELNFAVFESVVGAPDAVQTRALIFGTLCASQGWRGRGLVHVGFDTVVGHLCIHAHGFALTFDQGVARHADVAVRVPGNHALLTVVCAPDARLELECVVE